MDLKGAWCREESLSQCEKGGHRRGWMCNPASTGQTQLHGEVGLQGTPKRCVWGGVGLYRGHAAPKIAPYVAC